ncbi:class C beta-lactamase-related serine hydrolase [Colwellia sp. Arc7-635]|uniref:serine hydrolase domain-containing protein n=1 Tax=Colwellia sp. Arc7-635 TaxID=2497879 RepID=UPI000F84FE0A|nr:serine hydrolase [Colwellia sp. Arc7-635]AZQ83757.1 class C beta-lactamase-related serine hydrolase [Colwellia sp. Arc7-635]
MKINFKLMTLLIPIAFFTHVALATEDFSAIDRYVKSAKEEVGLPTGTAIAIVKNGKIIYEGYFGYADIKANKKVNKNTAFYIASITKPMFALSTLLMEEKGDIKDTSSMADMFPDQNFPYINAEKIQLKHLMSCSAGIVNYPLLATLAYTGNHDVEQRYDLLANSTNNEKYQLGKFKYTNLGFNIASVWAENYYKQDWQQTIAELIYKPLGMSHTSSYMTDAAKQGFEVARPYSLFSNNPREIYAFEKSNLNMHAAGGTISTAADLARFLIAQLNEGKVDGKQIFPAKVIKKSHQQLAVNDVMFDDFMREGYAWGWNMGPYKGQEMYHHFGGVLGANTHSSYMLKHNIGLIILNNQAEISDVLSNGIADIAYSILLNQGDADEIADTRITQMQKESTELKTRIQKSNQRTAKINASRVMMLSEAKSKYQGLFHNSLWGDLLIELLPTGEFNFTLGELSTVASAYTEQDAMRVEFPSTRSGKVVTFDIVNNETQGLKLFGEYFNKR